MRGFFVERNVDIISIGWCQTVDWHESGDALEGFDRETKDDQKDDGYFRNSR